LPPSPREQLADDANDDLGLLLGFRSARNNEPFSHFELRRSPRSAGETNGRIDAAFGACPAALQTGRLCA
jgi:hypothetical protein